MDNPTGTTDIENTPSNQGGDNSPIGSGNTNGRKPAKTRKPRTSKTPRTSANPSANQESKAQQENILDQPNLVLSEEEIETLLKEFPSSTDTPIPQAPTQQDFTSAAIILTLIDGMVQMALGPQYAMTKEERKMMADPLDRIMAKFPAARVAQYSQFVDPLLLLMGLIGWGSRIMRMRAAEKAETKKIEKSGSAGATNVADTPPQSRPAQFVPDDELMAAPSGLFQLGEV